MYIIILCLFIHYLYKVYFIPAVVTTIFLLQIFNGNSGRRDIVKHSLQEIAVASFIRFRPISLDVALRVELYGVIAIGGIAYLISL